MKNNEIITSENNKNIKLLKELKTKKYRDKYNKFTDEGIKNLLLAKEYGYEIEKIFVNEDFFTKKYDIITDVDNYFIVKNSIFKEISDTVTSQGIIGILSKKSFDFEKIKKDSVVIILDRIQDPGNAGTIIRTAEACNFNNIMYTKGTVDLYSPKVIRSTMGAVYFQNIGYLEDVNSLKDLGYKIYSSTLNDKSIEYKKAFTNCDEKVALVIGNEGNGISKEIIDISDKNIKINIYGKSDSLNASVAAGILIYELKNNIV